MKNKKINTELLNLDLPYLNTQILKDMFKSYSSPLHKIKQLIESGDLVQIKKGLYILGEKYQRQYSKYVLAGLIYGPSAISHESALSFYGLIPERVHNISSISFKRNKVFKTKLGVFTYKYICKNKYSIGLEYVKTSLGGFFISSPEKTIADMISKIKLKYELDDLYNYLANNLRIDHSQIVNLSKSKFVKINKVYKNNNILSMILLLDYLKEDNKDLL